jgi:3-phosphoshikimate 1-carboxyvinyltransferase
MTKLSGTIQVPADKSITHRAILFAALAHGKSVVRVDSLGRDNLSSLRIIQQLGVYTESLLPPTIFKLAESEEIKNISLSDGDQAQITIEGKGRETFLKPANELNCGNSGTTARLLTGILAGCDFSSTLIGDESLSKRPFKRVTEPLSQMGAKFSGEMLPLTVTGGKLKGINYSSPKASAQVKSAILLAGLVAEGKTVVTEPSLSRDHTERLLKAMGCEVETICLPKSVTVTLNPQARLLPLNLDVPGDLSSAAFFLVAGAIIPQSKITIQHVGINPSRTGIIDILRQMGAKIEITNQQQVGGEDVADLTVTASSLKGCLVNAQDVVRAIDEIPIIAIAAAFAEGETEIVGAEELRVKESDRLSKVAVLLKHFGVKVEERPDGLKISGNPSLLNSATGKSLGSDDYRKTGDHRIAMCGAIMEYAVSGQFEILDLHAIETSFPTFVELLKKLISNLM